MEKSDKQKRIAIAKRVLTLVAICLAIVGGIGLIIGGARFFAPIICAFLISSIIEPLVRLISRNDKEGQPKGKVHIPRRLAVVLSMLVVFSIIGVVLVLGINGFVGEVTSFARELPEKMPSLQQTATDWVDWAEEQFKMLPVEITDTIESSIATIGAQITRVVQSFAQGVLSWATSMPSVILFILFTVMSTYFLSAERYRIRAYLYDSLPITWVKNVDSLYRNMIKALVGYIKAQFIIMCALFCVMLLGFAILRVRYIILLAAVIALLDALPSIGTGLVLLPWAIITIISGNYGLGIGLLIVYLCVTATRQLLEPRVLSQQIGLHPLLTMTAMYAGLQLLGVFGMLIGPVTILIIKYVLEAHLNGRSLREYLMPEIDEAEAPPPEPSS